MIKSSNELCVKIPVLILLPLSGEETGRLSPMKESIQSKSTGKSTETLILLFNRKIIISRKIS